MFCVLLSGYFSNRCSSSCFYFCWFKISPMGLLNGPPISQASFLRCQANFICRYDGIGRHSRLKICLEQSSTGSSPVSGTTPSQISFDLRRFFYPLGVLPPEAIQRWLPQMPLYTLSPICAVLPQTFAPQYLCTVLGSICREKRSRLN